MIRPFNLFIEENKVKKILFKKVKSGVNYSIVKHPVDYYIGRKK